MQTNSQNLEQIAVELDNLITNFLQSKNLKSNYNINFSDIEINFFNDIKCSPYIDCKFSGKRYKHFIYKNIYFYSKYD